VSQSVSKPNKKPAVGAVSKHFSKKKKKKKKNKSYTGLEIKKFVSKSTFRKRLFWKFHNKWKFPIGQKLLVKMARIGSNSSKCLFLKWFFRCSAPKVQHIRMISTPFCAYGKGRFLGIFSVTIALKTFPGSGKNMFFSLPQRPLQATYGKSIILRLQRTFF
jgi:hypothetical protein